MGLNKMGYDFEQIMQRFKLGFYKKVKEDSHRIYYLVELSDGSVVPYSRGKMIFGAKLDESNSVYEELGKNCPNIMYLEDY